MKLKFEVVIRTHFSCHDLSSWDLWEDLFHIVRLASENVELADEIVSKAQMTLNMMLLWNLHQVEESPNPEQIQTIKKHQVNFLRYLQQLLKHHSRDKISEDVSTS